jgi:membrane protein DedA with SNARE-associated domain
MDWSGMLALFGFDFVNWIRNHLDEGGYGLLFTLLFCCGLGMPLPEDIPLLIAGALIAKGKMSFAIAAICAWCGIVGGDIVLYHLGKHFGLEVRRIPGVGRHLSEKRLKQVHAMFERWGVWVVAVGRMFAGIRGAMVVVAGATRFTFWKFLLADGLAAVVSGGLFLFLGFVFGKNMDALLEHVEKGKHWATLAVIIIAAGFAVWYFVKQRTKKEANKQAAVALREAEKAQAAEQQPLPETNPTPTI